jgi:hypothetical protein
MATWIPPGPSSLRALLITRKTWRSGTPTSDETTLAVMRARKSSMGLRVLAQNSALTFRVVLDPQSVSYDALRDLVALGIAWRTPSVLVVRSDSPYRSFAELIDYSKEDPALIRTFRDDRFHE